MTERMTGRYRGRVSNAVAMVFFLFAACPVFSALALLNNNLQIKGRLVKEPCTLDDSEHEVVFETVIKKGLYQYGRTNSIPFTVLLKECDPAIGNSAILTFSGQDAPGLTGYLAVNEKGRGIGIGMALKNTDNSLTLIPINTPVPVPKLTKGENRFIVNAWVEGAPEAIKQKTIVSGDFTAASTFSVTYP